MIERARVVAARLRMWEGNRGKDAPIHPLDPRVQRWAKAGISDPDLREAYERAAFDLERDGNMAPLTVGFLVPYIEQVMREDAKAQRGFPAESA